jgi:thymidylate kinase
VRTQDEVCRRVRLFSQEYPRVMLEGILVAHTYSRYLALAQELRDYTFLFLDTPLEVCIARVKARRLDRGNTKPLDPRNVIRDHERVHNVLPGAFREAGLRVVTLDWQNATGQALEVIRNGSEG